MVKRKYTTITIPSALFDKIGGIIKDTGFSSVSDYVTYMMREIVIKIETDKQGKGKMGNDEIMSKLRALGYL